MKTLEIVDSAYSKALTLCDERKIPVVAAQTTIGASGAVVWLDVDSEHDVLAAVEHVITTCAVRFVAASAAVDDDPEERSFVFIGEPVIGLRFGVEVDFDEEDDKASVPDADMAVAEGAAVELLSVISDQVSHSKNGLEPSERVKIHQQIERALTSSSVKDGQVLRIARSRMFSLADEVAEEIRRVHRMRFAENAESIADEILKSLPNALRMNATALRPLVHDHLRKVDRECATQRAGEPVVQAILTRAKAPKLGLF